MSERTVRSGACTGVRAVNATDRPSHLLEKPHDDPLAAVELWHRRLRHDGTREERKNFAVWNEREEEEDKSPSREITTKTRPFTNRHRHRHPVAVYDTAENKDTPDRTQQCLWRRQKDDAFGEWAACAPPTRPHARARPPCGRAEPARACGRNPSSARGSGAAAARLDAAPGART